MENLAWVCVYRDTIERHEESDNLAYVCVTKEFAEQYYEECIKPEWDYGSFEIFYHKEYTADDTEDFYDYAKGHNAIIDIGYGVYGDLGNISVVKSELNEFGEEEFTTIKRFADVESAREFMEEYEQDFADDPDVYAVYIKEDYGVVML